MQTVALLGRDGELQSIDRHIAGLDAGRGGLILLEGVAGVGKSALLHAVGTGAERAGLKTAAGRWHEQGISPPYAAWIEVFGRLAVEYAHAAVTVPEPFGRHSPAGSAFQLARVAAAYLRQAAAHHPLVVLLDDLHWAEQESCDLLEYLTRGLDDTAALIIAAYRQEDITGTPLARLLPALQRDRLVELMRLGPLDKVAARRLIGHYGLGPAWSDYLYRRSGGIPLYLIELLKDLSERGGAVPASPEQDLESTAALPVPTLLEQIFSQRLERLPPDVTDLLNVAAVVGEHWPLAVVEGVLDWPEDRLVAALEAALDARMVIAVRGIDECYRFAHALFQETLYAKLIGRRRRRLHGQVAARLAAAPEAAGHKAPILAYHYTAAGDWANAIDHSIAAADAARQQHALHTALKHYRQAADAIERDSAADPATRGALCEKMGEVHMVLNQKRDAEEAFSRMLEAARTAADTVVECRALCALSTIHKWRYRFSEAHRDARAALALARQSRQRDALVAAHLNYAHLHIVDSHPHKAQPHLAEVERLAVGERFRREQSRGLHLASYLALFRGAYDQARDGATRTLDLARQGHDFLASSGASFSLGMALGEQAQYTRARQVLRTGLEAAEDSGELHYYPKLLNLMGWLHSQVGDYQEALDWDLQALEASRRSDTGGIIEAECYSLLNLAVDELGLGRIARAEQRLAEFEALLPRAQYSRMRYFNRYLLLLAELALANDEPAAAFERACEAVDFAATHDFRKNMARGRLLAGQAQLALQRPAAAASLEEARQLADEIAHPMLRWQTRLYLGQLPGSNEMLLQAGDQLAAILTDLDDLHWKSCLEATPAVQQLRAATGPSQAATPPPAALTRRELEVLDHIAAGATNRTIAAALFISVKTVNTHVQSILRKTASDNRAAAAAYAMRYGILRPKS